MTINTQPPKNKIVTVFGGSGFVGRSVCTALVEAGYQVQIVSRIPERAAEVKTAGSPGQVALTVGNIHSKESVESCVKGSWAVINLVGVLFSRGKQNFAGIHAQAAERIAQAAKKHNVKRFVHMSALGVDKAKTSNYARTKINGEKAVLAAFPKATIVRPSIIFGPDDNFFNQFACLARFLPVLPLIGGGKTKFQPVYVEDIAKAFVAILEKPKTQEKVYELGGPKTYSFKELLQFILNTTNRKNLLAPLPFALAKMEAAILELLPSPILTRDQVRLLQYDNVVEKKSLGFKELKITPRAIEEIVPHYLAKYRKR